MKEKIIIVLLIALNLFLLLRDEKEIELPDYAVCRKEFKELQKNVDSLSLKISESENQRDSIKLQILRDEKRIETLDKHELDSAFRTLFKPRK